MRAINRIIIHCSATPEGRANTIDDIRHWHVAGNGWSDIGYHYVIHLDGQVFAGRPEEKVGAHASGQNHDSIGICYVGGMTKDMKSPKDTRTPEQKEAMHRLVRQLLEKYPGATVHGHREYSPRACPSFDVQAEVWDEGEGNRMQVADLKASAVLRIRAATDEISKALGDL